MKRWLPLSFIVLAGVLAIVAAEWHKIDTQPNADAVLSATADAQHELTRMPARLDRMSDEDEIRIGDQLAQNYSQRWQPPPQDANAAHQIESYIQTVGQRTAAGSPPKTDIQVSLHP